MIQGVKKGSTLPIKEFYIKEGETSPPKRYTSGSMILAMENAGQLIEDEELRAQIKGSGIGTSATRAEILKKLITIKYLALNKKTQVITPTLLGELVYEVPSGFTDFSIAYLEQFVDDSGEESTGETYFVYFTAEDQTGVSA